MRTHADRNRTRSWWQRIIRRRDEGGQALALVLGVSIVLTLGGTLLISDVDQQAPYVEQDQVEHQAYRALEAGLDEYLYKANANPIFATCTTANPAQYCTGQTKIVFDSWVQVHSASSQNVPSWYLVSNPSINYTTGIVTLSIVGVAGYAGSYQYQSASIAVQPENNFLLNVLWINYDQVDPVAISATKPPTCGYNWQTGLESGCDPIVFVPGDTLDGNVFVNDSIFVCPNPGVGAGPTFKNVVTADPNNLFTDNGSGCSGNPTVSGTEKHGVPVEPIPQDDSSLSIPADTQGCLYQGPTSIVLNGAAMEVTSPGTPTLGASGSNPNDGLDQAGDTNQCMPQTPGGSVALPSDGVVYVENCASCTSADDLMAGDDELYPANPEWTGGDAIVQGTLTGQLTIGVDNNIIIDGNLCYSSESGCPGTSPSDTASATDVLGLIATNFIEVNHPVTGSGGDEPVCGTTHAPAAPGCDLQNPTISAVALALNHSFAVDNWADGSPLGTLTIFGTIGQNWRGPVGTESSGSVVSGYVKNYQYDSRLVWLDPPYYLNPGTSNWGIASISIVYSGCQLPAPQTCPAVP